VQHNEHIVCSKQHHVCLTVWLRLHHAGCPDQVTSNTLSVHSNDWHGSYAANVHSVYSYLNCCAELCCSCRMQADTAASLKAQPNHTKLDEIQEEIQMQAPDTK